MTLTIKSFDEIAGNLSVDEGLKLKVYKDTRANWTWGYGFLLADGWDKIECDFVLRHRIGKFYEELCRTYPWVTALDQVRQCAMTELAYNLGIAKLSTFTKLLAAMEAHDYKTAVAELANSLWWQQVQPSRAQRILKMIFPGENT